MRALLSALALGCTLWLASTAVAQAPRPTDAADAPAGSTAESPAEERAAQFVGVTGPEAESVPGGTLLLAAYAVVWVLLFLFLLRMRGLQRQTAEELERLSAEVHASEGR